MGSRPRGGLASEMNSTRYQLWVVARDVGELVDLAGGWMCDRVLAGWDVSVAVSEPRDLRPLHILGITTLVSHERFRSMTDGGVTASIALAPGILENGDHIRGMVRHALDHGAIEVTFWGPSIPTDLHGRLDRRQYRLSGAARAFKAQAHAALGVRGAALSATEDFFSTGASYANEETPPSSGQAAGRPSR